MAPALIEAAATISQSSGRKLNFINTGILDNISNIANSRDFAIVSNCTLTTTPGRGNTIKVADKDLKNQISNKKELWLAESLSAETMDCQNNSLSESSTSSAPTYSEKQNFEQSSLQTTSATCALPEADGAKVDIARNQPLAETSPYIALKEKSIKTNATFQSLDRRAKSLTDRVKNLQANRFITHVQNQWTEHSLSFDPRLRNDLQGTENTIATGKSKASNRSRSRTINPTSQPSQLVNILQRNDSAYYTCPTGQSTPSGMSLPQYPKGTKTARCPTGQASLLGQNCVTPDKGNNSYSPSVQDKEDVFGVFAIHVDSLSNLDDPDATDPESDIDDVEVSDAKVDKLQLQSPRKRVDKSWARDRVKIGSMCTWIQAQVADLSHKIKRYGDLYHHAKLSRQQLVFEEARPKLVNPSEPQACLTDDIFAKSDTNTDDLQNNIFAKLQVHKNGLAKGLSSQQMTEIINERGSGARTIPVAKFPKHKYVKRNIRNEYKSSSLSYECSSLPAPFPCKQCQKACATGFGKTTGNLSAVFLDHSYHGQLSTKYDLQLPYLLESALRTEKIFNGRKKLISASVSNDDFAEKKALSSLASTAAASTNAMKVKLDRKRQRRTSKQAGEDSEHEDHPKTKKKAVTLSAASQLQKRASSLRAPSSGSGESRPSTPITEQSFSSSYPSSSLAQLVKKKSRPSSEYDINNIVIPYSISSSTRLEKPQYKEILTPGWRPRETNLQQAKREEEQEEDTSDDAYVYRHGQCEVVEHKRFTSYFQLPIRRSRSSRKGSECNTPEAYSPLHSEHSNSCFGSVSTPTEFIVATPLSAAKMNKLNAPAAFSLQLDDQNLVTTWPQRTFPLVGDDLCQLDRTDESFRPIIAECHSEEDNINILLEPDLVKDTPMSISPNNELLSPDCLSPCPEDEEKWTVKLVSDEEPTVKDASASRKGIVLKLAKK